jgi:hypothetical protein
MIGLATVSVNSGSDRGTAAGTPFLAPSETTTVVVTVTAGAKDRMRAPAKFPYACASISRANQCTGTPFIEKVSSPSGPWNDSIRMVRVGPYGSKMDNAGRPAAGNGEGDSHRGSFWISTIRRNAAMISSAIASSITAFAHAVRCCCDAIWLEIISPTEARRPPLIGLTVIRSSTTTVTTRANRGELGQRKYDRGDRFAISRRSYPVQPPVIGCRSASRY